MIGIGDRAPDFKAPSSQGQTLESDSFLGKLPMVLFFFPKIGTPGCDREIAAFNEHLRDFGGQRVQVLGVTRTSPRELREYADRHELRVPILADGASRIIRAFGVEREGGVARRVTFVVDLNGEVAHVFDPVDPAEHVEDVLETLVRLREERPEAMDRSAR